MYRNVGVSSCEIQRQKEKKITKSETMSVWKSVFHSGFRGQTKVTRSSLEIKEAHFFGHADWLGPLFASYLEKRWMLKYLACLGFCRAEVIAEMVSTMWFKTLKKVMFLFSYSLSNGKLFLLLIIRDQGFREDFWVDKRRGWRTMWRSWQQTSAIEAYHSVLLYWCPKMLAYSYADMVCR